MLVVLNEDKQQIKETRARIVRESSENKKDLATLMEEYMGQRTCLDYHENEEEIHEDDDLYYNE